MQTISSSTIKLNLPGGILRNAQVEANRIGISLQDFIRMLMATYFVHNPITSRSEGERVLYRKALQKRAKGEFTTIKSARELDEYLDRLNA